MVEVDGLLYLPGGGIERGESPELAQVREAREECGLEVEVDSVLCRAGEFCKASDREYYFEQDGWFFRCSLVKDHGDQSDFSHTFTWVAPGSAMARMGRASHRWAVHLALSGLSEMETIEGGERRRIRFRSIEDHELSKLLALYEHLHADDTHPRDPARYETVWNALRADRNVNYLAADDNGELVSTCHLIVVPNLTRGCRPYGIIENVVTHPRCRRRGIAAGLLRYTLSLAAALDCYKVMLQTGSRLDWVHKFYRDVGFTAGEKTAYLARPSL
jgi:GNAT superfamily N-acetyltransferase